MHRTAAERFALRARTLAASQARMLLKRPPEDPIRRRLMPRQVSALIGAVNRRDWELFLGPPYGPIVEVRIHREPQTPVGLRPSYAGREPLREMIEDWEESWDSFRVEPVELLDCGVHWVIVMRYHARGSASGVEVGDSAASLVLPGAEGYRLEFFWDPQKAIAAAGS